MIDSLMKKLFLQQRNIHQESWTFGFEIINCSQDHDEMMKWWKSKAQQNSLDF
jgi:hypothetical protein